MADIQKRKTTSGETRWDVRYRDEGRRQRKKTFERKVDAQRFANTVEADLLRGDWIDPNKGKELFEIWAERWLTTLGDKKPKTSESYESIVRKHLLPRFSSWPIGAIDYPTVLTFVGELQASGLGPGTIRNIRDVLRLVLQLAVRSGTLKSNPVVGVKVAKSRRKEMVFLGPTDIVRLASEVARPPERYRRGERRRSGYPEYGMLVRTAAFTGLRAGELVALRRKAVDLRQRRLNVRESASEARGELQIVATKTYEHRAVPVPGSLCSELADFVRDLDGDDFVWRSPEGGAFRYGNWFKRHFKPAVLRSGLPPTTRFHDLRHSYAAMLISKGAHPRSIMERLGHSTITVTLDTYGHLFPGLEAALDDQLDDLLREGMASQVDPQ
ncbi:MAG: tyrosine-type recombinase/integrase [Actinomycetota bacterium]